MTWGYDPHTYQPSHGVTGGMAPPTPTLQPTMPRSAEPPNQTRTQTPPPSGSDFFARLNPIPALRERLAAPETPNLDWSQTPTGPSGTSSGGSVSASTFGAHTFSPTFYDAHEWDAPEAERTVFDQSMLDNRSHFEDALASIDRARKEALGEKAGLDEQFASRIEELRRQFAFSETAEEQQMLARALGEIQRQRDEGYRAIEAGYADTVAQIQARGQQMAAQTAAEQSAVRDLYGQAQAQMADAMSRVNDRYDQAGQGVLGVAADGGPAGAADWMGLLAADGAAQEALTGQLGRISQDGAGWMSGMLQGQGLAQQADLDRLAMATSGRAQQQHDERVQARIARERELFNQLYAQTRGMYDQRGWDLGDTARDLLRDRSGLEFSFGEADMQRRLESAMRQAAMDQERVLANTDWEARARETNAAARQSAAAANAAAQQQADMANAAARQQAAAANAAARQSAAAANAQAAQGSHVSPDQAIRTIYDAASPAEAQHLANYYVGIGALPQGFTLSGTAPRPSPSNPATSLGTGGIGPL